MSDINDIIELLKHYSVEDFSIVFQLKTSSSDPDYYQWWQYNSVEARYAEGYFVHATRFTYPKDEFDDDWNSSEEVVVPLEEIGRMSYMTGSIGIHDLVDQNIFV